MQIRLRSLLPRVCTVLAALAFAATVAAQPKTVSQEATKGTPTVKTLQLSGTVVQVEGNQLLVKLASGEVRMFTPPPDRRFIIDGKELRLSELQPGTKLKATYTETTTPVTERTVQSLTGKVFYVAPPTVILTLENGENKVYSIKSSDPVKFHNSEGKPMTVFDLRKDMTVRATKITEAPRTELSTTASVTGTAPSAVAASRPEAAPPTAAPASTATTGSAPAAPRRLPKTASPLPAVGLLGLLFTAAGIGLRTYRRR